ncbi:cardiotrophin-like cytokine factor 1 [Tympanuchus pallidicinctus]|uniref:cardiotrophin-like cytokine factor 1 n=1 Tax=Tympanuchus pallidicinctus TaxID=109042 RepID=UPI00209F150E|nr:cardiotrophin-like cytokine factor 1 isoform X1 [Lagopus muta]XP_052551707.1 cardiotrophin-like cytokine factor 1 [Tympanuchus pallidicinctus]
MWGGQWSYWSTAASSAPLVPSHRTGVPPVPLSGGSSLRCLVPTGDSWGIFAFLCAALCNLPAVPALNGTEELGAGQSIQKTYDLTRYLEHQLRTLAGTYLNYLGPPFNEPDFNPPRLARAERVPSATVDLDLWRGLTDNARLAANYRAYSRLLKYLRGLDGQVGTVELRHRLGHFCSSLQGLVLSIAGVMSSLGYPLPAGPAGPPPSSGTPAAPNDFLKKMDDFWLLKELQTWLWRSAKDFNRLKKKVPPAVVTLRIEARGF